MFKIYCSILKATWKTFGLGKFFWLWLFVVPIFLTFTHITLWLDNLFFPKYRQVTVKKPIFIIGHPRSGTTFLHHLLTQTNEFATFETWQIFLPALTARALFKPVVDYFIKKEQSTLVPEKVGHKVAINRVEEEEFLFLHKLDTQFAMTLSPLAFDDQEYPELRLHDQQPKARRQSSVDFFHGCLQRHIYYTGKPQVVAQTHYSLFRIKTLLEFFPDAKFIYLVRSPYETLPSHFSLNWHLFDYLWGLDNISQDRLQRYYQRRYCYNTEIYRHFYQLQKNREIPEDQVMVLPYKRLRSNLAETFEEVVNFAELDVSAQLRLLVKKQSQGQSNYKRKHQVMHLDQFDITKQQITKDLSFVFEEYGLEKS